MLLVSARIIASMGRGTISLADAGTGHWVDLTDRSAIMDHELPMFRKTQVYTQSVLSSETKCTNRPKKVWCIAKSLAFKGKEGKSVLLTHTNVLLCQFTMNTKILAYMSFSQHLSYVCNWVCGTLPLSETNTIVTTSITDW